MENASIKSSVNCSSSPDKTTNKTSRKHRLLLKNRFMVYQIKVGKIENRNLDFNLY